MQPELMKFTLQHNGSAIRPFINVIIFSLLATLCIATALYAIDEDVKKMLRQATGITDEDVAAAERKEKLTLFDAFALAVRNTERLAIEGEYSMQAKAKRDQAIDMFLPYVSLRANMAYPWYNSRYTALSRSAVGLYARQPIFTGLNEISTLKSSLINMKVKQYQLYHNADLMLADVAVAYYTILLIERNLDNNEQLLRLYEKMVIEIRRRIEIGRSRQSDLLRTNGQIYKLRAEITALRKNLEHAKLSLATLTGMTRDYSLAETVDPGEPAFAVDNVGKVVENRWDVKAAKEYVEWARTGVMAAWGGHLPLAYLEGAYFFYQDTAKTPQWQKYLGGSSSPKLRDYYISLGVELPIINDITFGKVREANSIKRQSDLGLSQTVRIARQDIIDSYQTWENSRDELEAFHKALVAAEQNNQVVSNEYRLNQVTILDVLVSLTALQSARDDYERALLQLKLNRMRLGISINEFTGDRIRALK